MFTNFISKSDEGKLPGLNILEDIRKKIIKLIFRPLPHVGFNSGFKKVTKCRSFNNDFYLSILLESF